MMQKYDVVVVGAGAAGMMCSATAGARGRRVLLLDHAKKAGQKIRISGGGRCNFTNIHTSPKHYLSQNPRFCVSALKRYTPQDFIDLVERYGIAYHEKKLGQLFCDHSAQNIIDMLLEECNAANVDIRLGLCVDSIAKIEDGFTLRLSDDVTCHAHSVVIATGGPPIPKMGATGWAYDIARQFNVNVVAPSAALVPFTLEDMVLVALKPLAGVSQEVRVSCGKTSFEEAILFTHRGISGPATLQISSYWKEGNIITVDLLPEHDLYAMLLEARKGAPKQEVKTFLSQFLPKRLALYLCEAHNFMTTLAELSNARCKEITQSVKTFELQPNGTEGYRTAEVALGGVDTTALSSKTMEVRDVPGLFFIGEAVDVTGHLGGFNFQWAWASGYAAGHYV